MRELRCALVRRLVAFLNLRDAAARILLLYERTHDLVSRFQLFGVHCATSSRCWLSLSNSLRYLLAVLLLIPNRRASSLAERRGSRANRVRTLRSAFAVRERRRRARPTTCSAPSSPAQSSCDVRGFEAPGAAAGVPGPVGGIGFVIICGPFAKAVAATSRQPSAFRMRTCARSGSSVNSRSSFARSSMMVACPGAV